MGRAMKGQKPVSLRGPPPPEDKAKEPNIIPFRSSPELRAYLEQAGKASGSSMSSVIRDAIELDRDLAEKLRADRQRLEAFASEYSLSMHKDLAEIMTRLIRRGLDMSERERKSRR